MMSNEIKLLNTAYYHAQANPTERYNRTIKTMIASYINNDQREWDLTLPKIQFAMNSACNDATNFSPAFLNFGREPIMSGRQYSPLNENKPFDFADRQKLGSKLTQLPSLYEKVRTNLKQACERSSKVYNLRRKQVVFNFFY